MNESYQKELDPVALGLTKSPMFMGVNLKVFFGNMALCALICLHTKMLLGLLLFIGFHLIASRLSVKEPNFISIYWQSFIKTPPTLNRKYWGKTNSYEPW
jgi:type IV secretion system protein VirB3